MNEGLKLRETVPGELSIVRTEGETLWTYHYEPETPANESPRPYVHPLYSIDGDVLTNWRPNDHPWHHGLSLTLTSVDGVNFWGGPSHRAEDGYRWRDDHGVQRHVSWKRREAGHLIQNLNWCDPRRGDRVLLKEERTLITAVTENGWSLRWLSRLHNPGAQPLVCHNYHSLGGLTGSHYTGLQFRGARGLLDQHGDDRIGVEGSDGCRDAGVLHGRSARWLEWHAQHDGSLRRTRIRFESASGEVPWFVRPADPLVAFPPHGAEPWTLAPGSETELDHLLHFQRS